VQQQYVDAVGGITVARKINSVHSAPNIIAIRQCLSKPQ